MWHPEYGSRVFWNHEQYVVIDIVEYQGGRVVHLVRAGLYHWGPFARIRRVRDYNFHTFTLAD